jgi:PAS domain-containing protein
MSLSFPSPLTHSWPLFEQRQRFDLGCLTDGQNGVPAMTGGDTAPLTARGIGLWECDLHDNALTWTAGVYDLFGLPRGAILDRDAIAALYAEPSRAAMERLRAHAIKHRRGFTLDAEIVPVTGPRRWMRLIAAPVCVGRHAVRLHGIKQDVTALYRDGGCVPKS